MKKALFIDRDGTMIAEPPVDFQVDSLEKLTFIPGVIRNLYKLRILTDFELVMVTNQDGLGTSSFPEDTFWPAHNMMLDTFKGEGIEFDDILIDRSFPEDNAPTRKPRTGMMGKYLEGHYDLKSSYVIGDRQTDIELAKNLGAKGILFSGNDEALVTAEKSIKEHCAFINDDWDAIYNFLKMPDRLGEIRRSTKETDIHIKVNLDGKGKSKINSGLNFFDHMLEQLARHSFCDMEINVRGDLHVDEHHTIEDTAIALGEAVLEALGDKRGIERYGFLLPMDDCLAQAAIDFSGRPWLIWDATFVREKVGDVPTEMFMHFFKSFSDASKSNLNIKAEGDNEHHKIEAIFKAVAKSIKMAVKRDPIHNRLPSTKGLL